MGCCCSCRRTSNVGSGYNIRVVDINGSVQDFDYPIIVRQLITAGSSPSSKPKSNTGSDNQLFVSTAEKLLSSTGSKQLGLETQLHPGHVYFLLPFSTLKETLSPTDYVRLVKKLNSVAKSAPRNTSNYNNVVISNGFLRNPSVKTNTRRVSNCGRKINRTWKPILSTIREVSFNRRSESDLLRDTESNGQTRNC